MLLILYWNSVRITYIDFQGCVELITTSSLSIRWAITSYRRHSDNSTKDSIFLATIEPHPICVSCIFLYTGVRMSFSLVIIARTFIQVLFFEGLWIYKANTY